MVALLRRAGAECVGTYALVTAGCGAVMVNATTGDLTHVGVALDALWGGPISGAFMNPARSFGPALISGTWQDHWIYWLGPLIGACIGAIAYQILRSPKVQAAKRPQEYVSGGDD